MHGNVQRRRALRLLAATLVAATVVAPTTAEAGTASTRAFTATSLSPTSTITVAKSTTGKLAETDPALLGRTDATPVQVVVKLDYDATASYKGDIDGLAATSPSVTGTAMTGSSTAEKSYESYTGKLDTTFRTKLAAAVPSATAGISLQQVYGGVAVTLPANQVSKVLAIPGVAAVQSDVLQHVDRAPTDAAATVESPTFIGAPAIWSQVGGQALAGKGVIFGDLDTGVWPEHPMLADNPALGNPPPKTDRTPRACNFGDNPLTPGVDVFVCNHKLIGGQNFLQTYNKVPANAGEHFATTARDSDGHGTHTATTAAGDIVAHAPVFGIDRGPISGVAPGAWVIEYKVCGANGCYGSDTAAAVAQAIKDGVNVINFSISGGAQPYSDPTELAFLDAYNAGILVAASAGNSGPGAGTTDHQGPWVLTVAASSQSRDFQSTLTLTDGAASTTFVGTSIMNGLTTPSPVVLAKDIAGYEKNCLTPLPAGSVTGKIVACERGGGGGGRVEKGKFVAAGGAAGMILYNPTLQDTESDNHYLPAIHLADGTAFLAFMAAHPTALGSFTPGVKAVGQGDVMAAFSSRGPGKQFLKPDITAPGVQVLAGHTPVHPGEVAVGPEGEYYQAIAGTSMSSPHIAGSGILMKALHPDWTPGKIKSALMTTANTSVLKEDEATPADPFDDGAGRVDLTKSGSAPIVFDETGARMNALGEDAITALDLNIPSIDVPTMPGTVTVKRTATNVTTKPYDFDISTTAPAGSKIKVTPAHGRIKAGLSQTFTITITSKAATGQYFGQITFDSSKSPQLHLPVAFFNKQGEVTLTQNCDPATIVVKQSTTCTVTAANESDGEATVGVSSTVTAGLAITGATGAVLSRYKFVASAGPKVLSAPEDATPAIDVLDPNDSPGGGYLDLAQFGVAAQTTGDESNTNFSTPDYVFGGQTYNSIGVDSNGYINVGGGTSADVSFEPQTLPDPKAPNGVIAPYWTDLNDNGTNSLRVGVLGDGTNSWIVVQWDTFVYGEYDAGGSRRMQVWIGVNGTQDITYAYDTNTVGVDAPDGTGLTIGAESLHGVQGAQIAGPPASPTYIVTSSPRIPGGTLSYTLTIAGQIKTHGKLNSEMTTDVIAGTTRVSTPIEVTRR